jgi:hypothetical protein
MEDMETGVLIIGAEAEESLLSGKKNTHPNAIVGMGVLFFWSGYFLAIMILLECTCC